MEAEATFTVQQVAATAVMLYLCKSILVAVVWQSS